jgi:hypothetical protein
MPPDHLRARHNRCLNWGDALGIVIYRPSAPDHVTFTDIDTGKTWRHGDRAAYRSSAAYKIRRARLITGRRCDHCGDPHGTVLWTADSADIGAETSDNTIVLCRHCNNRAYRARQSLGLAA